MGSGVATAVRVRRWESTVGELAGAWPPRSPASEEPHALSNRPRQQIAITCGASAAALDADMRGLYRWHSSRLFAAKDTDARGNRSIRVASMDGGDRMSQPSVLMLQMPCQEECGGNPGASIAHAAPNACGTRVSRLFQYHRPLGPRFRHAGTADRIVRKSVVKHVRVNSMKKEGRSRGRSRRYPGAGLRRTAAPPALGEGQARSRLARGP